MGAPTQGEPPLNGDPLDGLPLNGAPHEVLIFVWESGISTRGWPLCSVYVPSLSGWLVGLPAIIRSELLLPQEAVQEEDIGGEGYVEDGQTRGGS
jgi:hypothetical protein